MLSHHFVHGSTLAVSQRYSRAADETVAVGGPAVELDLWARDAGLFAAHSLLHATRAICRIFGWPEPPDVERLLKRVEEIFEAAT
ncbi:MAG TPA: hypothetical protein VG144_00450 [Gaiellaceae bacterium]|nr:hypothetical protein [Gaiellaceae bacterium]